MTRTTQKTKRDKDAPWHVRCTREIAIQLGAYAPCQRLAEQISQGRSNVPAIIVIPTNGEDGLIWNVQ